MALCMHEPKADNDNWESWGCYWQTVHPQSGEGEDFLMGQLNFFTKTAVAPEQKDEKSIPNWEINRHAEG